MTYFAHGFPAKYFQGPGELARVGETAARLGASVLLIADEIVGGLVRPQIEASLDEAHIGHRFEAFSGECCEPEIERVTAVARECGADLLIAAGGGKALDAGKVVAERAGADMISVPTIASTDAPVSSVAVIYSEDHIQTGAVFLKRAPSAVIVDTQVIANAPARLLSAGMGDALATWYEARACAASGSRNFHGGGISQVGLSLSRLCRDVIIEQGKAAFDDVSANRVSDAVEAVVEANTFLSGVGFENTGVAGAHALDGALTRFTNDHRSQHGERVGVGILMQMMLEGDAAELALLRTFYEGVGLPRTLSDLGLAGLDDSGIGRLAGLVTREGSQVHKLPFEVTTEAVTTALTELR